MKTLFLPLLCLIALTGYSQKDVDERSSWSVKDRGYLGIGLGGLGLGTNGTGTYFSVGVTPMVGYMLTPNLSGGLAFEYQYTSYSDIKLKIHQYGWYPFLRYNIKNFFLQTDYDWYRVSTHEHLLLERFFVGVGYSQESGSRVRSNFLVSYDVQYENTGPFTSPLSIRIFLTF